MYDLIIIGSGPAGLTAAIYASRARLSCLVLEKAVMSGGQMINTETIDNYPGLPGINGFDLAVRLRDHAESMGATFAEATVEKLESIKSPVKCVRTDRGTFEARALILAAGAEYRKLGIPGEEKFSGRGVSYCAVCDGAFYRGKTVAVIGGGDVAVEDAILLSGLCQRVFLIHRRDRLRAAAILQEQIKMLSNVEILWNTRALEIVGDDYVEHLILEKTAASEENSVQKTIQNQIFVDGVFVAIGMEPASWWIPEVERDEKGWILAEEDGKTSVSGVFAAGDLRKKPLRQIITAMADGANSVISAESYIRGKMWE